MELEKDLLSDVLGPRAVGENPVGDRDHLRILRKEEPLESIRDALTGRGQGRARNDRAPGLCVEHLINRHRRPVQCDGRPSPISKEIRLYSVDWTVHRSATAFQMS